jgi:hypothetical protein
VTWASPRATNASTAAMSRSSSSRLSVRAAKALGANPSNWHWTWEELLQEQAVKMWIDWRVVRNLQKEVQKHLVETCPSLCNHFKATRTVDMNGKKKHVSNIAVSGKWGSAYYNGNLKWDVSPSPERLLDRLPRNEFSDKAIRFLKDQAERA